MRKIAEANKLEANQGNTSCETFTQYSRSLYPVIAFHQMDKLMHGWLEGGDRRRHETLAQEKTQTK